MSDSSRPASLPERPNLEQLKKQAKELRTGGAHPSLAAAQRALAQQYGFASWAKLKLAVELITLKRWIEDGDAGPVRTLLESSPRLAKARFDDGSMPLHLAAGENRPEVIDVLLEFGAPLATKYGASGHSALSWAVTCWAHDAALRLIERGSTPDLFSAAGLGLVDRVREFWPDGKLRRRPSKTGSSRYSDAGERLPSPPASDADQVSDALYIACRSERVEVARWLLDHGADPNWLGYAGASCLAWAEFSGNAELCALLRERGGSEELVDQQYRATPRAFALMVFAGWGFPRQLIARLTVDRSLVAVTGGRGTLLHAAADGGQEVTAKILLAFGADRKARDPDGRTPAEVAGAQGHTALAALLA